MNHKQSTHITGSHRLWTFNLCVAMFLTVAFSSGVVNAQARTVRVGVYQNEPKIFMDENGRASGIFIELLDQIAAQEGWTLVYVPCEWDACLRALEEGQIDLMPDVAYSLERAAKYDFHKTPVLESWSRVYASPNAPITKIPDLDGKRIAVLKGSIQHTVFDLLMNGFGYQVTFVLVDSFEQAFALAANGSADAAITNQLFGDYFYQKYGLLKTTIDFNPADLYYATAEGRNLDLLAAIDRYLGQWIPEPGSPYYTTLGHWAEKEPALRVPSYVFWVMGGILGLLVIAAGMILLLRQQVKVRTRHLVQANAELQRSEQHFQTLARISPVGIFRTDPDGATTYVNPTWCAISGVAADQALGDGWLAAVHPDDKARLRQGWQASTRRHQASFSDYRFVCPDGTLAWVMGQAVPELNAENQIIGYVGTITDITERKQAEARVLRLNQLYATLSQLNQVIVQASDRDTLFRETCRVAIECGQFRLAWIGLIDEATQRVTPVAFAGDEQGYLAKVGISDQDEDLGRGPTGTAIREGHCVLCQDMDTDPHMGPWHAAAVQHGFRSSAAVPIRQADQVIGAFTAYAGEPHLFDAEEEALLVKIGQTISYALDGLVHEAQRRQAEANLKQRNLELATIGKIISATTTRLDLQDILDRALQGAMELTELEGGTLCLVDHQQKTLVLSASRNASTEMVQGLSAHQVTIGDCLCGNAAETGESLILWDNASGSEYATLEAVRNEGIHFHAAFPLQGKERNIGVICIFSRDTAKPSERSLTLVKDICGPIALAIENAQLFERAQCHAAELSQRVAERTDELRRANDQLRTKNDELKAFAYTVSHDLKAPLRGISGYAQELDRRHRAALSDRAQFCLTQIMTATLNLDHLIEDLLHYSRLDAETPTLTHVNLREMIDTILRDRARLIAEQGTQVEIDLAADGVSAWERGLLQALTNLIDNALKYSRKAAPPKITLRGERLAQGYRLSVADNGVGFDMKYHDRIFGLFNRLVRADEFEGTGAGLAIARKAIEKQGGKLWAEAQPGAGATFFIELP